MGSGSARRFTSDLACLAAGFESVTQVLTVSSNARSFGGDRLAQHHWQVRPESE
jgi:hypothetical protein